MPTYEYVCEACGHAWEARQSMKDDPLTDCPECGEPKAKRQVSLGAGFILKGGGWYSDLYGNKRDKRKAGTPGDRYKDDQPSAKTGTITSTPSSTSTSTSTGTDTSTSTSTASDTTTKSSTGSGGKSSGSSD